MWYPMWLSDNKQLVHLYIPMKSFKKIKQFFIGHLYYVLSFCDFIMRERPLFFIDLFIPFVENFVITIALV